MSWKYLIELECEREIAKPWDREKAKESTFITPYISPPSHFVIQSLKPAPLPKPSPKKRRCRDCKYHHRVGGYCIIKRERGIELKGYCPLDYMSRNAEPAAPKSKVPELCVKCEFLDKVKGTCLMQRLGRGVCIRVKPQPSKPEFDRPLKSSPMLEGNRPCRFCDYFDKVEGLCILEVAGQNCVYSRPRNIKVAQAPVRKTNEG